MASAGKTFLFVTYELAPVNRGGAGVVIAAVAEALAAAGHAVHLLVDMPSEELEAYRRHLASSGITRVETHLLASLTDPSPTAGSIFAAKSCAFRNAVHAIARRTRLDAIEFFEYAGAAFHTLALRTASDPLRDTPVVVRIHGSLGMIDDATLAKEVSVERHAMYRMEEWSLRLADTVLAPLEGIGAQYQAIYGIDPQRLRVCPPPMETLLAPIGRPMPRTAPDEILYWGKLHPVKGADTFVSAALGLLESRPDLRFVLVGPDTPDVPEPPGWRARVGAPASMRTYLDRMIPDHRRDRFTFLSYVPRSEMASRAARALCAVVPSRAESFCLVAHELARSGCPLILSDIPAFSVFEEGRDALHFDGTPGSLAAAIDTLVRDPSLREELAGAGARRAYPPVERVYEDLPQPRSRREDVARFAAREVESIVSLAAQDRQNRIDLGGIFGSKGWRLIRAGRALRDRTLAVAPRLKYVVRRLRG